jgi:hypothetical protein
VQGQSRQIVYETPFPNYQSKMDWWYGLSSRVPTLQAQNPEFKPRCHQKKKAMINANYSDYIYACIRNITEPYTYM